MVNGTGFGEAIRGCVHLVFYSSSGACGTEFREANRGGVGGIKTYGDTTLINKWTFDVACGMLLWNKGFAVFLFNIIGFYSSSGAHT